MKKTSFLALSALILMLSFGKVSMASSVSLFDATFDGTSTFTNTGTLLGTSSEVITNGSASDYYAFTVDSITALSISVVPTAAASTVFYGINLYDGATTSDLIEQVTGTGNLFYEFVAQTGITYFLDVFGTPENFTLTVATPIPAAIWLFGSALMGLIAFTRRKPVVSTVVT